MFRRFGTLLVLGLISFVLGLGAVGCEKTPEDVRKWEKDRRAPDKMKEFILEDNSLDVKTEAVMVLVERGEASNLIAIFEELDAGEREEIVDEALPRITELIDGENQHLQVQAKDAAYFLIHADITDEQKEKFKDLLLQWIAAGDNFWRPNDVVGKADKVNIFEALGPKGLPVLKDIIGQQFDLLAEAKTDERKLDLQRQIQGIVMMAEGLNLPETDEMLAELFVQKMEAAYPDIPEVYGMVFMSNKSDKLKPMAKKIMLSPHYQNPDLTIVRDLVVNEYYKKMQTKEGVAVCAEVVKESKGGFVRWQCALTLLDVTGADAVDHVFLQMPNDPSVVPIPDDHYIVDQGMVTDTERYWWDEVDSFCRSTYAMTDGSPPLDKFRKYLESDRLVEKMMALRCLSWFGEPKDVDAMRALAEDETDITDWNPYPGTDEEGGAKEIKTLGDLATKSADDWKDQSKSLKEE